MKKRAAEAGESDLAASEYRRLAEFRYLLRRFLVFSQEAAEEAGLTPQQHQALLAIKGHAGPLPITPGVLAERLAVRPNSAVGLIDRLEARGYIRRSTALSDRRQVQIELTPKAGALLRGLALAHKEELRRLAPLLRPLLSDLDRQ